MLSAFLGPKRSSREDQMFVKCLKIIMHCIIQRYYYFCHHVGHLCVSGLTNVSSVYSSEIILGMHVCSFLLLSISVCNAPLCSIFR